MAKNLSGDLQVASANRLSDGAVVFLDDAGQWTHAARSRGARPRQARAPRSCWSAPRRGRERGRSLPGRGDRGRRRRVEPLSLREKIRASGLTFDAIAAEAVRYA